MFCTGICDDKFRWRYRTSCYHLSTKLFDHPAAIEYCQSFGATLISIETIDELKYIHRQLPISGIYSFHIITIL